MILILNSPDNPLSPGPALHSVLGEYCSSALVTIHDKAAPYHEQVIGLAMEYSPKIVINCHEYPDLDASEYEPERAYEINGFFLKYLSDLCRDRNIMLVHMSSSYVFSGSGRSPSGAEDEPDPVSVYGDSKLLGERIVVESGCRHAIIRTPDLFGEGIPILNRRLVLRHDDCSLQVIKGQVVSPAYSGDLARAVSELISRGGEGMYHFSQGTGVSTAEYIVRMLDVCLRHGVTGKKFSVTEVEREDFLAPGERPMYNVLADLKMRDAAGTRFRGWEQALEDCISRNHGSINLA